MIMTRSLWSAALACGFLACGSSQTNTAQATAEPSASPVDSAPTPVASETAAPTAEPTAAPTAATGGLPPPSGRPATLLGGSTKVSQMIGGSPATKIELEKDHSIMRVPEWALNDGYLITFMIDDKGKKATGGTGSIYHLFAQIPPAEDPSTVMSRGPAFTFKLPTGKGGTANLAVGEVKRDGAKETITWKVIAPKSTEDGFATFELTEFTNDYLQVTTASPSP